MDTKTDNNTPVSAINAHTETPAGNVHPLVASNPTRYRELRNGAVYDREVRHIVAMQPAKNAAVITKENSQSMHDLRRAQTRDAILAGIAEGTGKLTWQGGIQAMSEAMAKLVVAGGNRSPEAFRVLLHGADVLPDRTAQVQAGAVSLPGAPSIALIERILILTQPAGDNVVIDGEIKKPLD